MAEVLIDLPKLSVTIDGRKEPIIKRTRLITKTSSMPVATHEASVYTGITVAEHFRDQGKAVALIGKSMLLLSGASRKRTNSHPSQFHLRSMVSSTSTENTPTSFNLCITAVSASQDHASHAIITKT